MRRSLQNICLNWLQANSNLPKTVALNLKIYYTFIHKNQPRIETLFFFFFLPDNSFKFHKVIDYRVKKFSLSRDIKWHWDSLFLLKIFKKNCWPKTILDSLHSSTWWWTGEKKVTAWNNLLNDYITKMALGLFGLVEVFQLFYTFWGYLGMSRDYCRRFFFLRIHKTFLFFKISIKLKQLASVWKWISWNLTKFQLSQLIQAIVIYIFCLIDLKFFEVSRR